MSDRHLKLVIGNKNLSSWSLRPWILLKQADILFDEQMVLLDLPSSRASLRERSPSGLVPCLVDGVFSIWDSLAICEYIHDQFPEKGLWPREQYARARARSLAAEMHSGFSNLRTVWPMEFAREGIKLAVGPGVKKDVVRILSLWRDARTEFGETAQGVSSGPFLFGAFSIADAMFAPVVSRFKTYGPVTDEKVCTDYIDAIWALPSMQAWGEGAHKEVAS